MASSSSFRQVVWPLAIAETILWAALYYMFPALLPVWERDMGWTKTELSGAFTLALVITALFAPFVGRLIDHGHGRRVFIAGATLGALMLLMLARVNTLWQFYCVFFCLGLAMSSALYEACFAILTHALGDQSKKAITLVTLMGGLAGSISFPSAHALSAAFGWRTTLVVFAAAIAFVAIPLIWIGSSEAQRHAAGRTHETSGTAAKAMGVMRTPTFWLLAVAFLMIAIDHGALITHILPILSDRGIQDQAAVLAASMIGPMQVSGRLAMLAAERHVTTLTIAMGSYLTMAMAAAALLHSTSTPGLVVAFVILHGAGYGVTSILRPVVIAEIFGRGNFGVVSGLLTIPFLGGVALSPTLTALVWRSTNYDVVLLLLLLACLVGLLCLVMAWKVSHRPKHVH